MNSDSQSQGEGENYKLENHKAIIAVVLKYFPWHIDVLFVTAKASMERPGSMAGVLPEAGGKNGRKRLPNCSDRICMLIGCWWTG
jgi:hypothetical protein